MGEKRTVIDALLRSGYKNGWLITDASFSLLFVVFFPFLFSVSERFWRLRVRFGEDSE